uniref:ATP synthase F0 subunit 8 n=1 Tax=Lernaea cyprinacea TaxID=342429 RepID=A0A0U1XG19_9MAXI|nr:ATP synthase F0 subunit 8 [Lernaea cyprinacea]AIQ80159.1 ATP synthase F0 subunit 8 [Lernaea cyprinacea]UVW80940.1 ATP synthase F0 subunit 8 [Lernaea cyprinacea]
MPQIMPMNWLFWIFCFYLCLMIIFIKLFYLKYD